MEDIMKEQLDLSKIQKVARLVNLKVEKVQNILTRKEQSSVYLVSALLVNTFEEAKKACDRTPDGTGFRVAALKRLIELCKTPEEAKEAYNRTSDESEEERLALKKIYELIQYQKSTRLLL